LNIFDSFGKEMYNTRLFVDSILSRKEVP